MTDIGVASESARPNMISHLANATLTQQQTSPPPATTTPSTPTSRAPLPLHVPFRTLTPGLASPPAPSPTAFNHVPLNDGERAQFLKAGARFICHTFSPHAAHEVTLRVDQLQTIIVEAQTHARHAPITFPSTDVIDVCTGLYDISSPPLPQRDVFCTITLFVFGREHPFYLQASTAELAMDWCSSLTWLKQKFASSDRRAKLQSTRSNHKSVLTSTAADANVNSISKAYPISSKTQKQLTLNKIPIDITNAASDESDIALTSTQATLLLTTAKHSYSSLHVQVKVSFAF